MTMTAPEQVCLEAIVMLHIACCGINGDHDRYYADEPTSNDDVPVP